MIALVIYIANQVVFPSDMNLDVVVPIILTVDLGIQTQTGRQLDSHDRIANP